MLRITLLVFLLSLVPIREILGQEQNSGSNSQTEQKLSKKLKIAVGRFTNETRYGKSLLRDGDLDPLGKQALDILSTMLTGTNQFLVFERPDLVKIEREQRNSQETSNVIGVDTLILGSITEFGRSNKGKRGVFNRKKEQTARATVSIRLVDVATGLVFHSAIGSGEATTSAKTVLGVGSTAEYDQTLNDRAISAAINQVINELVSTITARPWKTDLLQVDGQTAYIAGGKSQGLKNGDILGVFQTGKTIASRESGFNITLPAKRVGAIKVIQLFGDMPQNEGAVTTVIEGDLSEFELQELFISEDTK